MRRLWQDIQAAFGAMGHPVFTAVVYWSCAALAWPVATEGGYDGAVGGAFVFCLAILFLAYFLGVGAMRFAVDARRSCLPRSQRLARRVNLLAFVILLPAIAIPGAALASSPVWRAWVPTVLVLGIALAGVMVPLVPIAVVAVLFLAVLAVYWAASGHLGHEQGIEIALSLIPAALAIAAIAKWRQVYPRGSRRSVRSEMASWLPSGLGRLFFEKQSSAVSATPHGLRGPRSPVGVIRTCFGGSFRPIATRSAVLVAGLLLMLIGAAVDLPWLGGSGWRWGVGTVVIIGAGLVSSGFVRRITNITRDEIAELALIPGLGDGAAQRRALYRAVLVPPLYWLGGTLMAGSTALLLKGAPLSSAGILAVSLLAIWLTYTGIGLRRLSAPRSFRSFRGNFILEFLVLNLYIGIYAPLTSLSHWLWWVWFVPVFFAVAISITIYFPARRLAMAPHPFLA
ncbi:MAG: hypothetical protein WBE92_15465 [Steroidobacteraceae bacterium]